MEVEENAIRLDLPLSPALRREIEAEIADHAACAESRALGGGKEIASRLASPKSRRALAAPHVTDQVISTLTRWPSRAEWREFAWLVFWYAVVFLADWLSSCIDYDPMGWRYHSRRIPFDSGYVIDLYVAAWLLSAIGRAGFFIQFGLTLVHAFRRGAGVLVARLIQLKLIHTILVAAGFVALTGRTLDEFWLPILWEWKPGMFVNQWTVAALGAVALVLLVLPSARRLRIAAAFALLLSIFLIQGAPVKAYGGNMTIVRKSGKSWTRETSTVSTMPMTPFSEYVIEPFNSKSRSRVFFEKEDSWWTGPYVESGSGLGWLAFPIPLMGVLSLLAMTWLLGRGRPLEAMLYTLMSSLALFGTIGPFVMGSNILFAEPSRILIANPTPCFDNAFTSGLNFDLGLILFGFFLSALLPWLMVGLFARTRTNRNPSIAD
ncbi:MAG: hypothetical protein HRF49_06080 [bacterium]|jgi:hypothetical protein